MTFQMSLLTTSHKITEVSIRTRNEPWSAVYLYQVSLVCLQVHKAIQEERKWFLKSGTTASILVHKAG